MVGTQFNVIERPLPEPLGSRLDADAPLYLTRFSSALLALCHLPIMGLCLNWAMTTDSSV